MIPETFDKETALDLVVNAVPLGMLTVFVLMFVIDTPYGIDPVTSAIQLTLVLVPLGALVVLSYHAAKAVEAAEAEEEAEAETEAAVETETDTETTTAVPEGADGPEPGEDPA